MYTLSLHDALPISITAVENIEEFIPIPSTNSSPDDNLFVLIIEGESMIEAGIHNGDMVIDRQQTTASNGEIIVAMTEDDEATEIGRASCREREDSQVMRIR